MSLDYEKIGRRIKKIRKQKHLSQAYVCEQLNRDRTYLCHIETAKRYPSLEGIVEIANYLASSIIYSRMTFSSFLTQNRSLMTKRAFAATPQTKGCTDL